MKTQWGLQRETEIYKYVVKMLQVDSKSLEKWHLKIKKKIVEWASCEEFSFKAKICDHFAGFVVTASPLACKILTGLGLVFLAIF